jgi:hypothetical protein
MISCQTTHARLSRPITHSHIPIFLLAYRSAGQVELAPFSPQIVVPGHWEEPAEEPGSAWRRKTISKEELILMGLRGKLSEYLRSQGVRLEQYSHALLVTALRFLGFSFNPVSFWYLYNEANLLEAMVGEVNNTFDERRMYFMERKVDGRPASKESVRNFKYS